MKKRSALLFFFFPAIASAQQLSCDDIAKSKVPYELQLKKNNGDAIVRQIYRSAKNYVTTYENSSNSVFKLVSQSNFIKKISRPNEPDTEVEWSVPTDRFLFENSDKLEINSKQIKGKDILRENRAIYTLVGKEDIPVGPCVYEVQKYRIETKRLDIQVTERVSHVIWYSKELQSILKSTTSFRDTNYERDDSIEAQGITVSFIPFK